MGIAQDRPDAVPRLAFADGPRDADDEAQTKSLSKRGSQATLTATSLPDGCSYGEIPSKLEDGAAERVIWVDFPPGSQDNPFYFTRMRKVGIVAAALVYTWFCSTTATAFAVSAENMCREIGCSKVEAQAGIGLYAWGASLMPLIVAPFSEEFGRRPTYLTALAVFWFAHMTGALAQNTETALVARFLAGAAGTIGTSVVGGTISDIFIPAHRGLPMALSGFTLYFSTGIAGTIFSYVDVRLGWRWVWWLHCIGMGAFVPFIFMVMCETRTTIILRQRAAKLRKERGLTDGGRYLSHAEMEKIKFMTALKLAIIRPILFLLTEPLCMFFSLWVALAWSVMYVLIAGLPYMCKNLYGFNEEQTGLVYIATCVGAIIGLLGSRWQERLYRRTAAKKGVEARLYGPMVAGVTFFLGCYIVGFTALPSVHWIASAVGQTVVIASVMTIYVTAFTYVSECYGIYASSAMAGQSFSRNLIGGVFAFVTTDMFEKMTPRWAIVMMGSIAGVLMLVPFGAYLYGPQIRAHSKYSRMLMQQERDTLEAERLQRQVRGMDVQGVEDLEGDANEAGDKA